MTKRIPIIALPNALLFPKMVLPIQVYEEHYSQMMLDVGKFNNRIGIVLHKSNWEKEPAINIMCCVGEVGDVEESDESGVLTVVTGLHRAVIEDYPSTTPYIVGTVNPANETVEDENLLKSQSEKLSKLIMKYIFTAGLSDQLIQIASMMVDCSHLTDFFAFYLIKDVFVKQTFLETLSINKRCEMATSILEEEIKTIKA